MKTKPTWAFVAGGYRSGSTLQYLIARDIVEETETGIGIGYHTEQRLQDFDKPGPRYVVCKVFEFLPEGFRGEPSYGKLIHDEGRMRALVTVRDPRDVIVSMRARAQNNEREFSFKGVATTDLPRWLGNVQKWIDLGDGLAHWSKFEDITAKQDRKIPVGLLNETKNIAAFLGIKLDDGQAEMIAQRHTIAAQRKAKERHEKRKNRSKREDPWLPEIPQVYFGTSGHNASWLSRGQRNMVVEANKGFMERFGYD